MWMRSGPAWLLLPVAIAACAPTNGPVEVPTEVLLVLDAAEKNIRIYDVDSTEANKTIALSPAYPTPTVLAARSGIAAVGFGTTDSVALVNLISGDVRLRILGTGGEGSVTALAFGDDGTLFIARRATNRVDYIVPGGPSGSLFDRLGTGSFGHFDVSGGPQGFGLARGNVFAIAGNRQDCDVVPTACDPKPSYLVPLPPTGDSIPMAGPGNAMASTFGPDGSLYVLNSGNGMVEGRLSQINPVTRIEQGSFGGLGNYPKYLASDGVDKLYVASDTGLMVFSTTSHSVTLGSPGIPLHLATALVADDIGRAYVIEAGQCSLVGTRGLVRIFGTDLVERPSFTTGICPVAAATTELSISAFPGSG
jgi:hypothetical protein